MKTSFTPFPVFGLRAILIAAFCLAALANFPAVHAAVSAPPATPSAGLPAPVTLSAGWQLQDIAQVPQAGDVVSTTGFTPTGWYKATIPGTVLTSLVNDGVYAEPLYGENNRPDKIPESLCRTSYWYRTQFDVPARYAGRQISLNFEGINYTAQVWLNGRQLGDIRGAFARGIFNITAYVKPGEKATLAVLIQPPPHPGNPAEQTLAAGTGGNGGQLVRDGPTFVCAVGWDWIPAIRDRDMGIWQKVTLSATGPVLIVDPYLTSHLPLPRTDSANLTLEATLQNISDTPQSGNLAVKFGDVNFSVPYTLAPKTTQAVKLTPETNPQLHVANPRLWWPNGYGEPNLYALHLSFDQNGQPSDTRDFNFGIREITYQLPGSDNLAISVNGVPVMCKGGDWGMDEAMKRIPRDRLEAQIRFHKDANYTMIRNWVGQSTGEDFYDLCDKYGIMIWDEFFQANASDGPVPDDVPMYLANVREKVLRFRNHPSIALWCGRNESNPAPAAVADGLQAIMAELESARAYHANSNEGKGVRSGGPYNWQTPRMFYAGPRGGALEPFKTEIGSVSIPTLEAVQAMMPEKDWNTINDDWAEHDLCRGAQEGRQGGPLYPDMIAKRYGPWTGLAEFVRKSQLANYEAFRAMYEGRFAKLFQPATGVLTWMSNPSQPSFVWQLYSYDLEPLSSLFAVRKASEPIHVQMNQNDFHVMVINNTPKPLENLQASVRVYNLDGSKVYDHTTPVASAGASAATDVGAIAFPDGLSPVHFVKVELRNAQGQLLSDNFYWRETTQDDLTALDTLPEVSLDAKIVRHDADGKCLLDVTLTNPTKNIALMAHLQLRKDGTTERVLPVHYSDNYISLLPGESRTVTIEAASKDLGGAKPLVMLDGWNVNTKPQTFSANGGAVIAPNTPALVKPATATVAASR